jgi:hypothetical protein
MSFDGTIRQGELTVLLLFDLRYLHMYEALY